MHTTTTLNRRSLVASTLVVAASAAFSRESWAQTPAQSHPVGIGSTKEEWTAAVGEPAESGDQFTYVSPINGSSEVTVGFTDDIATFMEYRFGAEGESRQTVGEMLALSIPQEAMMGEHFSLPAETAETGAYGIDLFVLPSENPTPGLLALYSYASPEPDADVTALAIGTTSEIDVELPITGDPGGIALDRDAWIAAKGDPPEANYEVETYPEAGPQGMEATVWYMPQDDVIQKIHANGDELDVLASTRVAALEFVGQSMPADARLLQHVYLPSTEVGPLAVRIVTLASEEASTRLSNKGSILAMLHERIDDPEPMVTRVDLAFNERR